MGEDSDSEGNLRGVEPNLNKVLGKAQIIFTNIYFIQIFEGLFVFGEKKSKFIFKKLTC